MCFCALASRRTNAVDGTLEEQKPRIEKILKDQLLTNLEGCQGYLDTQKIVIGYEPIWAIGPWKKRLQVKPTSGFCLGFHQRGGEREFWF